MCSNEVTTWVGLNSKAAASATQSEERMNQLVVRVCGAVVIGAFHLLALAGCERPAVKSSTDELPKVSVSAAVERNVTDYAEFTGRLATVDSVEVRAHVWGYLEKVNFKEGTIVNKGEVLFELDARPYQALLEQAKAKVLQDEAQFGYDDAENQRNLTLVTKGAVTKSDLDKTTAARNVDLANITADKAAVRQRELDLEYTKIRAPVTGRVSRYDVTVGNLVQSGDQAGGTLLTTIVSVDPMYVYFDVDENTVLRVRNLIREGKAQSARDVELPVRLALANEEGFAHQGTINFVDNQLNAKTGTIRVRGVFRNEDQFLSPGLFARVRVPIGRAHKALLISEIALDNDQGQKIVYVVNEQSEVTSRPVKLGEKHAGLREIVEGLNSGERVVVSGLPQIRPGIKVDARVVEMPGQTRDSNSDSTSNKAIVRTSRER
jgi:RND family efflux transporter MFP subunit